MISIKGNFKLNSDFLNSKTTTMRKPTIMISILPRTLKMSVMIKLLNKVKHKVVEFLEIYYRIFK